MLQFQTGKTTSDLLVAPLTQPATDDGFWYEQNCLPLMGDHYFNFHTTDYDCTKMIPVHLMFHNGDINGFVWQHSAPIKGDRFEDPG
jgi:hypothetical protein